MVLLFLALALLMASAFRRLYLIFRYKCKAMSDMVFSDSVALVLHIAACVVFAAWVMTVDKGPDGTRYYANGVNVTGIMNAAPVRFLGMVIAASILSFVTQYLFIGLVLLLRKLLTDPRGTLSKHGVAYTIVSCLICNVLISVGLLVPGIIASVILLGIGVLLFIANRGRVKMWKSAHKAGFILLVTYVLYILSGTVFAGYRLAHKKPTSSDLFAKKATVEPVQPKMTPKPADVADSPSS